MIQPIPLFKGVQILPSLSLVEPKVEEVQRGWKERLWSWPWAPWVPTKFVTTYVASRTVINLNGVLYAHPDLIEEIQAQLDKKGVEDCPHKEWTEESAANGWRSSCVKCGIKAQGSCQG
jgi:hypothetical protein